MSPKHEFADDRIGTTFDRYTIVEKLGQGGMGVVYKARDQRLQRFVALKLLPEDRATDPERRRRFLREARAASGLNHPNVVTVHEVGLWRDVDFIVMEFVSGRTLEELIAPHGLPQQQALDYAHQIAGALEVAHAAGVIHRDLKPSNVIVTSGDSVKILDFGLARFLSRRAVDPEDVTESRGETRPGVVLGTPAYMSPEQRAGAPADARSDIFSLGVLLYEMLTGPRPRSGPALTGIPTPQDARAGLPETVMRVLWRALAEEPHARFQTAAEFRAEIEDLRTNLSARRWDIGWPFSAGPRRRAFASRWIGLAALLASVGAVFVTLRHRAPEPGGAGVSSAPKQKHLALLPFVSVGLDESPAAERAFVDGLVETLASKLTQLEPSDGSVWVVPFTEVRSLDIDSVAEAQRLLAVTLVVTGSFQRTRDRARLTMNLVDANTLRQLASTVIDRELESLWDLQDRAAVRLAHMLDVELEPGTVESLTRAGPTQARVHDLYLQARGFLQRHDQVANVEEATDLLRQALGIDPTYAPAHASLGEAYWRLYEGSRTSVYVELAEQAATRAMELDPGSSEALVTLGLIQSGTGRDDLALRSYSAAIEIEPRLAMAHRGLASVYESLGRLKEAEAAYRGAIALRPDYWEPHNTLGIFYFNHGRYEEAIGSFTKVVALAPDSTKGYNNVGGILYYLERNSEAREMFERSLEVEPNYVAYSNLGTLYFDAEDYSRAADAYEKALRIDASDYLVSMNLANAFCRAGDEQRGRATYERVAAMIEERLEVDSEQPQLLANLAVVLADTSRRDEALGALERALAMAPDNVEVMISAAEAYTSLGQSANAASLIDKAMQAGYPSAEVERNPSLRHLLSAVPRRKSS